jgi:O-methyltransferase involved in polyketide biosynthesis
MDDLDWVPVGVDTDTPSAARMYDYFLGGAHNFAADRLVARKVLGIRPALLAQANRSFLRRAVRFMVERGIDQFVDLGCGVPTVGNVHEIAQRYQPDARVVYVDTDPIAMMHARHLLAGDPRTVVLQQDLRRPDEIFGDRRVRLLLDPDRPVGVLAVAVLHFLTDADDPGGVLARIRELVPAGSHLAISHGTADGQPELVERVREIYRRTGNPPVTRTRAEVERLFGGWRLVEPGLVWMPDWRPEDTDDEQPPDPSFLYGGVAVKA